MAAISHTIQLPRSLDDWMGQFGDDFGFLETAKDCEVAVSYPGTAGRVEEMRLRVQRGQPLFVRGDSVDFAGGVYNHEEPPMMNTLWEGNETNGIELSYCGRYQYRAMEIWDKKRPVALFAGLYPMKIRNKLYELAHLANCGGMHIVNLFALRVDHEEDLVDYDIGDAIGPLNDRIIRIAAMTSHFSILGWGEQAPGFRSVDVFRGIRNSRARSKLFCYGLSNRISGRKFPVPFRSVKSGSQLLPLHEQHIVRKELGVADDGE
jgi:hypothetical protein